LGGGGFAPLPPVGGSRPQTPGFLWGPDGPRSLWVGALPPGERRLCLLSPKDWGKAPIFPPGGRSAPPPRPLSLYRQRKGEENDLKGRASPLPLRTLSQFSSMLVEFRKGGLCGLRFTLLPFADRRNPDCVPGSIELNWESVLRERGEAPLLKPVSSPLLCRCKEVGRGDGAERPQGEIGSKGQRPFRPFRWGQRPHVGAGGPSGPNNKPGAWGRQAPNRGQGASAPTHRPQQTRGLGGDKPPTGAKGPAPPHRGQGGQRPPQKPPGAWGRQAPNQPKGPAPL